MLPFVLDFKSETRTESKHLPVSVNFRNYITFESTMTGTNNPGLSRTRFIFSSPNREIFKQNLFTNEQLLYFMNKIEDSKESIDFIAQMFVSCVCEASVQSKLNIKHRKNQPWFDQQCILCGFHTRARSVTNTTIDKSQLIGTFCQNLTF